MHAEGQDVVAARLREPRRQVTHNRHPGRANYSWDPGMTGWRGLLHTRSWRLFGGRRDMHVNAVANGVRRCLDRAAAVRVPGRPAGGSPTLDVRRDLCTKSEGQRAP